MAGRRVTTALVAFAASLAAAIPAAAQIPDVPGNQGPPAADPPTEVQPGPVPRCKQASLECVDRLARHLRAEWQRYDATCDHRAVVLYAYLQITRGLRRDLAGPRPALVKGRRYMTFLITTFSNRFREAFSDYAAGRPVTDGWRIAFEAYDSGEVNAGQDTLLFSSVHVQYDLPLAYEEMGIATRSGESRKADHDAVDEINRQVFDRIQDYISAHYDPTMSVIDAAAQLDEVGTLELVENWRENGWRYAERLLAAETEAERDAIVAEMEANARDWAQQIASGSVPGTRAQRDAYCMENHEFG